MDIKIIFIREWAFVRSYCEALISEAGLMIINCWKFFVAFGYFAQVFVDCIFVTFIMAAYVLVGSILVYKVSWK